MDKKIDFICENKTAYSVEVKENDGYSLGEYYFKFTREEYDIIKWFLGETLTENNYDFVEIKESLFSERGKNDKNISCWR